MSDTNDQNKSENNFLKPNVGTTENSSFLTPNNPFDNVKPKTLNLPKKTTPTQKQTTFRSMQKGTYKSPAQNTAEQQEEVKQNPGATVESTVKKTAVETEQKKTPIRDTSISKPEEISSSIRSTQTSIPITRTNENTSSILAKPTASPVTSTFATSTSAVNNTKATTPLSTTRTTSTQSMPSSSTVAATARSTTQTPRTTVTASTFTSTRVSEQKNLPETPIPASGQKQGNPSEISSAEFTQLREFLYEQSGIYVTDSRKYLFENRLTPRLRELNLNSYSEYLKYLKTKDSAKVELNKFYEQMTTNETSFFRNIPQLETVQKEIFEKIIEQNKTKRKIRIWSAGCSSGEEPYTFAIMLSEMLKSNLSAWDIKITANDLSPAMLKVAEEGIYGDYALRTTPKEYIKTYFTEKDNMFHIKPNLKKLIKFGQINLNDASMTSKVEKSQVVFCRNVIIYFDDDVRANVVNAFYNNLEDDGTLVIGHSETLQNVADQFKMIHYKGTSIYHKI